MSDDKPFLSGEGEIIVIDSSPRLHPFNRLGNFLSGSWGMPSVTGSLATVGSLAIENFGPHQSPRQVIGSALVGAGTAVTTRYPAAGALAAAFLSSEFLSPLVEYPGQILGVFAGLGGGFALGVAADMYKGTKALPEDPEALKNSIRTQMQNINWPPTVALALAGGIFGYVAGGIIAGMGITITVGVLSYRLLTSTKAKEFAGAAALVGLCATSNLLQNTILPPAHAPEPTKVEDTIKTPPPARHHYQLADYRIG